MQNNTIRQKLFWNFSYILGIMMILLIVNMTAMWVQHRNQDFTHKTEMIRSQMAQDRLSLTSYLLSGDKNDLTTMEDGVRQTRLLINEVSGSVSGEQKATISRLSDQAEIWNQTFASKMAEKRQQVDNGNSTAAELQIEYVNGRPDDWTKSINTIVEQVETQRKEADSFTFALVMWITALCTFAGLGFGGWIAWRTAVTITEPLTHLISVTREIGESGDLDQQIDVERDDEIGELAHSFNETMLYMKEMASVSESIAGGNLAVEIQPRSKHDTLAMAFSSMVGGLCGIVTQTREAASQVASGSDQVAAASEETAKVSVQSSSAIDEVTSTMHEMSINVQNMVKNTQMQASSVSQTSASIDEMVASIQRVADTAKVLLDISNRSREEVQNGIATMQKTTDGLNRINESISLSASIIDALGKRADDIGKIVEVIDDISEQTNLLALNAAIEAARAGEHGLGFAVVADEVRKLAEKSASSTKEISELIQSIQNESRKAVDNMDKSTVIVNEGLTLGSDLSGALKKISNVVTEVYKFAQEIGAATNEQSLGSSQIARATARLNEITHEINSSVEEQASGAQAVVRAMERMRELIQQSTSSSTELAASSEQMSKMARTLLESMDRFTTDGTSGGGMGGNRLHASSEQAPQLGGAKYALSDRS